MQDRYAGDIGDFVKYALLRAISPERSLGVAWYLHPNEGPSGDGRHVSYLSNAKEWRYLDADLFDVLREIVFSRPSIGCGCPEGLLITGVGVCGRAASSLRCSGDQEGRVETRMVREGPAGAGRLRIDIRRSGQRTQSGRPISAYAKEERQEHFAP